MSCLALREAAVGDAVLDDRLRAALVEDVLPRSLAPARDVEVGQPGSVGLDRLVDGVRAVQMADARPGVDRADVLASDFVITLGRRIVRDCSGRPSSSRT